MAYIVKTGDKWFARVRRKGFPERTATRATKALVEKWVRETEAGFSDSKEGVVPSSLRMSALFRAYSNTVGETRPFGRNKRAVLKTLAWYLGDVPVNELTPQRIVSYIKDERRVHGVTAAIDLTYLSAVMKFGKAVERVPLRMDVLEEARDALHLMGLLGRSNERDRRPTADELAQVRRWLETHDTHLTGDIIDFILDSGFRPPSEIVRLRWSDLNEQDRTIVIRDRKDPKRKIGNNQTVPLLGRCMEIIKRQPRDGELIFPYNGRSWSAYFSRACKDEGIEDLRLYDLRHESLSRLVESHKYSLPEIMLVSGHKDPKQLMRYTQLQARDLHDRDERHEKYFRL